MALNFALVQFIIRVRKVAAVPHILQYATINNIKVKALKRA